MTPVRLEPAALRSRVKHSTTEPLRSRLRNVFICLSHIRKTGTRSAVGYVSGNRCSLTADPGVASLIPVRSNIFVEIDHEIISTVILLPFAESFKKGCCQLQAKVCAQSTGKLLVQACPGKSVVR